MKNIYEKQGESLPIWIKKPLLAEGKNPTSG